MKKNSSTIVLVLVFFVGLSILLYPSVADWWNSRVQTRAVTNYDQALETLPKEDYSQYFDAADAFNEALPGKVNRFLFSDEERAEYNSILDIGGGMMGYIQIEKLDVTIPIYHGTSDPVLQVAVGHIEGTALPVGGIGTHCALSGHRGLPSARLFTDLDQLVVGDTFVITVLDRTLTYQVDQILIVEPHDMSGLDIDPEMDYCTLVTCTPYGINSHRLLVRGHRIENAPEKHHVNVVADAVQMNRLLVASVIGAGLLLVVLVAVLIATHRSKNEREDKK